MIEIAVESASDIDIAEAKRLGVTLIPIEVFFGEESYLDGVNLSKQEFFEKLIESDELPKTSQISEFRYREVFSKVPRGDELIVITLSSKLSGTYYSAVQAAREFENVRVVDSLNATIGERLLVELALRLRGEGRSAREIVEILEEKRGQIHLLAALDTLEYLKKGGRLSAAAAFVGSVLAIKPVVAVVDGEVKVVGKAMGSKKSNNLLMQQVEKSGGIDFSMPYCLGYSGLNDDYLKKYLSDSESLWRGKVADVKEIPICRIGSTIGTHVGPGAVGVAFFGKI